ncbi:hypothetical protein ILUMI_19590 [Ignelater luminosus]|uniref:Sulfotransferase domain-containing protein n=1 Tax=Ignelater luminosus TaxID=2038154 RepID=A0A8K0CFX1_IGNLU|nr:hypothetical protein ILUMI_19590 [Ignelater luminosus]
MMDFLNAEKMSNDDELGKIMKEKILNKFCKEYVSIGEDRTSMPVQYLQFAEQIKNFEVLDDDIWIVTYPRTGTTWSQEMIWMIANNLDFEGANEPLVLRFPFLELSALFDEEKLYAALKIGRGIYNLNSVEFTANLKRRPRFIKTHLPYSLLPDQIKNGTKKPKIIYVARNPKDTCVSFCHHGSLFVGWKIDVDTFAKLFIAERSMYGSFWKHVLGFWKQRDAPNIFFIKYEDMKEDHPAVIRKVARFLGKELTDEQVGILVKHLSFESMKKNNAVNWEDYVQQLKKNNVGNKDDSFIRIGKVGTYKKELSPDTIKEFDAWTKKNITGTSLENEPIFNM